MCPKNYILNTVDTISDYFNLDKQSDATLSDFLC